MAPTQHAVREVRAVERSDENGGGIEAQLVDNVGPDTFGRGRREGMQRDAGEVVAQPPELAILRPEIVAPLADAVRLVDRNESHAGLLQQPSQHWTAVAGDTLRRHV